MKNMYEKSTKQLPLSDATKKKLFVSQRFLYIKYRPRRTFLQWLLGGMKHVSR
ncbi:MAG: hypothetical protein ABF723_02090 [Lentilactobacillus hilgardii]|uniref:hypothetical protein n=1 Tax=Lentilactobacillus hilgardii TaxID=1588 RepID=UPI001CC1DBD1|nr:hypothetical protein [Lentilactobacillus hilgardii]